MDIAQLPGRLSIGRFSPTHEKKLRFCKYFSFVE
jgi:hypothetical protein